MAKNAQDFAEILRTKGFRATPMRIDLLQALSRESKPLSVASLSAKLRGNISVVTVYRALEALARAGIVRRSDFGHGHADYEFAIGEHHHHLVCEKCGVIEDVTVCVPEKLLQKVLEKSGRFKTILNHSMEFFGMCRACASL